MVFPHGASGWSVVCEFVVFPDPSTCFLVQMYYVRYAAMARLEFVIFFRLIAAIGPS